VNCKEVIRHLVEIYDHKITNYKNIIAERARILT
jgi:hypothetical protein